MPYIGNTVQTQGFTPAIDYFSGNGVTVTFTLSRPVVSASQMIVAVDNVVQNPSSAFTVSGSSITFTSAPLSGTNNIWVEYTSLITTYNAISQDPSVIGDITASGGYASTGDFGNSFLDGVIVDYVTGNARITTGTSDGITLYNGGTSARTALAAWDTSGNLTNTGNGSFNGVYIGRGAGSVSSNTAVGASAGVSNTTGAQNTFIGSYAGYTNAGASYNTAVGYNSLTSNSSGAENTAVGVTAMGDNSSGSYNTAVGKQALKSNTTASNNTAVGYQAGYSNSTSIANTFVGYQTGYSTTGQVNCFVGNNSGALVTTGSKNTILGAYNGNAGGLDIRTASNNIVLSDGDGNPKAFHDGNATWTFRGGTSNNNALSTDSFETYPYPDNVMKCGYPSYRWTVVYAVSGTINTSDATQKQQIRSLDVAEKAVATRIKGLIKAFKWNDSVAEKGDGARIHVGVIAQEVQAAFIAEGLDPSRYAMFCSDTWYEVDGDRGRPANPYTANSEGSVEVTQLGIRYDQLLSFVISAL